MARRLGAADRFDIPICDLRVSVSAQAAHTLVVPFLSEFHIMDIVATLYIVGSVAQVSPHVYMCEFGDGLETT